MLQIVHTNAITVMWETDGLAASSQLEWGRAKTTEHTCTNIATIKVTNRHFVHRARVTGLAPATRYLYRVRCGSQVTPTFHFRTAPFRDSRVTIGWWSDSHDGRVALTSLLTNLLSHQPDLLCVAGDVVNNGDVVDEWHNYWCKPLETLYTAQTIPVLCARGNHDNEYPVAVAYNTYQGTDGWFALSYGPVRLIFLNSTTPAAKRPAQRAWLAAELDAPAARDAAFRIVTFHHPPFANVWDGPHYTGEAWIREEWVPLFERYHVDLVINGHAHAYQRATTNGVTYLIIGGAGGVPDCYLTSAWPCVSCIITNRFFAGVMTISNTSLHWALYDITNNCLDTFTLTSRHSRALSLCTPPTLVRCCSE